MSHNPMPTQSCPTGSTLVFGAEPTTGPEPMETATSSTTTATIPLLPPSQTPVPVATTTPPAPLDSSRMRSVLIIDGSYAHIGARQLGGRMDYLKLRRTIEATITSTLLECWFFDHEPIFQKSAHQSNAPLYNALKLAPPKGPQFQLKLYAMKPSECHCPRCGLHFSKNVQKGVDNGIATKILSLSYENVCDRIILLAGDGDFYDSLNQIKNVLRKDFWVIGFRHNMSADLQTLASRVIWIEDLWDRLQLEDRKAIARRSASSPPRMYRRVEMNGQNSHVSVTKEATERAVVATTAAATATTTATTTAGQRSLSPAPAFLNPNFRNKINFSPNRARRSKRSRSPRARSRDERRRKPSPRATRRVQTDPRTEHQEPIHNALPGTSSPLASEQDSSSEAQTYSSMEFSDMSDAQPELAAPEVINLLTDSDSD